MASNIKDSGVDLDSIFEAISTTKIGNVNIKSGGNDISNLYEDINSGSAASATGIKTGGADLNTKFAELGSVGGGGTVNIGGISSVTESGVGNREIRLRFNSSGIIELYRTSTGYVQKGGTSDWIDPHSAADSTYEVRMNSISSGGWTTTPAATGTWVALGTSKEWKLLDTNSSPFIFETVNGCVFQIRKDGGSILESTTLPTSGTWTANRTS